MITWLFNKAINQTERDTGYSGDYLRDVLATSKMGFFKLTLAFLVPHPKHASKQLHQVAQLGAIQQESCGPCLEISKSFAIATGVSKTTVQRLLLAPETVEPLTRATFLLGRHVAGGEPLLEASKTLLEKELGKHGLVELTVSAAAVRIYPALKRGMGYADMCAIPDLKIVEDIGERHTA